MLVRHQHHHVAVAVHDHLQVVRDQQYPAAQVAANAADQVEGTQARAGTIDPLGAEIDDGPELSFELMRTLAASFNECLDAAGQASEDVRYEALAVDRRPARIGVDLPLGQLDRRG